MQQHTQLNISLIVVITLTLNPVSLLKIAIHLDHPHTAQFDGEVPRVSVFRLTKYGWFYSCKDIKLAVR